MQKNEGIRFKGGPYISEKITSSYWKDSKGSMGRKGQKYILGSVMHKDNNGKSIESLFVKKAPKNAKKLESELQEKQVMPIHLPVHWYNSHSPEEVFGLIVEMGKEIPWLGVIPYEDIDSVQNLGDFLEMLNAYGKT